MRIYACLQITTKRRLGLSRKEAGTGGFVGLRRIQSEVFKSWSRGTFGLTRSALPLSFTPWTAKIFCKNILGKINSYGDNVHDFPLLVVLMKTTISIMALLMPYAVTSPLLRDGEVPFIR